MPAVRSFLRNRIAMYLVMISMVMSFAVPSIRTDYSDLTGIGHSSHEIHILDLRGMGDCILEVSATEKSPGPAFSKNGSRVAKSIINTSGAFAFPDTVRSVCGMISCISFVPIPPGIRTISSFLIISIYLKDGNK